MDLINCKRRQCREVTVGNRVHIGGGNPVVVQSMTNTTTTDIPASIAQIERIAAAGAELVRLTAQGVREAEAMGVMSPQVSVPLVADIHFNPRAALAAAEAVDKVRINPGNFCRPGADIEESLLPLLEIAKRRGVALRIGSEPRFAVAGDYGRIWRHARRNGRERDAVYPRVCETRFPRHRCQHQGVEHRRNGAHRPHAGRNYGRRRA